MKTINQLSEKSFLFYYDVIENEIKQCPVEIDTRDNQGNIETLVIPYVAKIKVNSEDLHKSSIRHERITFYTTYEECFKISFKL